MVFDETALVWKVGREDRGWVWLMAIEDGGDEMFIGLIESRELAEHIVTVHNDAMLRDR